MFAQSRFRSAVRPESTDEPVAAGPLRVFCACYAKRLLSVTQVPVVHVLTYYPRSTTTVR